MEMGKLNYKLCCDFKHFESQIFQEKKNFWTGSIAILCDMKESFRSLGFNDFEPHLASDSYTWQISKFIGILGTGDTPMCPDEWMWPLNPEVHDIP